MEFANDKCDICGVELGDAKPKKVTKVKEPYTTPFGRYVQFVAACPSCGKKIPLWAGNEPEPEPTEAEVADPEPAPEPKPEEVAKLEPKAS